MYTHTKKILVGSLVAVMGLASPAVNAATVIGTGTVTGSGALTSSVTWNDTFPGTATGTINGILVQATVLPTLNMVVSGSGVIDLGNLTPAAYSSGSINIEIGTNAANGASVTARSTNGGLKNTTDATQLINSAASNPTPGSYKFASALVGPSDSAFSAFTSSATLNAEVIDSTTSNLLYTSNKPQALSTSPHSDFSFTVSAKPNAQAPAGKYTDVVVLTVTGNF